MKYVIGKGVDGSSRLIKAGTKINFQFHLHSTGTETAKAREPGIFPGRQACPSGGSEVLAMEIVHRQQFEGLMGGDRA